MKAQPDVHEPMTASRPGPWFALTALLYIPAAWFLCSYLVRGASIDDYLTVEFRRAITTFHLPASVFAVALCVISFLRYERPLWLSFLLFCAACSWLGLALGLSE